MLRTPSIAVTDAAMNDRLIPPNRLAPAFIETTHIYDERAQ